MGERTCTIEGCGEPHVARSWCEVHYRHWKRNGDPLLTQRRVAGPCLIEGCPEEGDGGHGWCATHYRRWYRRGDPLATSRIVGDDLARFLSYVDKNGPIPEYRPDLGPCWLWTGLLTEDGYGVMAVKGLATASAHRWSYLHHCGAIAPGLEIDHLCRVRACVNPGHLEAVTHVENLRRMREALAR